MQKGWFLSKKAIIIYHTLFWLLFLAYPFIIRHTIPEPNHHAPFHNRMMLHPADSLRINELNTHFNNEIRISEKEKILFELRMLGINIYNIAVFYLIGFILIPKYFNKKSIWKFIGLVLLLYAGFLITDYSFNLLLRSDMKKPPILAFGFSFVFVVLLSIAYSLISDRIKLERKLQENENANLKTELQFLRSQISPHFMFNVLNNMVSMARKKSDQLENSLIQLSGLMRYMLYEVKNDKVPLNKEIEFLNIYIDLQQQRMKEGVISNFYLEDDPHQFFIEPMLLIPFVENAFKHSQSVVKPNIEINLILTKGKLSLKVKNNYDAVNCRTKDNISGIGFVNVKRRLQILYGSKSNLEITKTESEFQVQLHIEME